MATTHKNKTFATFLALALGGVGAHRFYLRGPFDKLGLLHAASVPMSGMIIGLAPDAHGFFQVLPVLLSYVAGFLEALIIGLTPDDKFDAAFNAGSGKTSESKWILAVLLVTTMLVGTTTMIATMSRLFDLLYTGGSFG